MFWKSKAKVAGGPDLSIRRLRQPAQPVRPGGGQGATRRTIDWEGTNRIQSVADQGRTSYYAYDDQGQRVLKAGPGGRTRYINRYYSVRNGAIATKQVIVGDLQIVSLGFALLESLLLGQGKPKSLAARGLSGRYREGVQ